MTTKTTLELRVTIEAEGSLYRTLHDRAWEVDDMCVYLVGPNGERHEIPEAMFTPKELAAIIEALIEAREDRL